MRAAGAQTRACAQQWGGGPGQNFSGSGNNAKRRATAGLIKRIVSSVWQHTTGTAGLRAWRPTHVYTRLQQQQPEPRAATCCVPPVSTTLRGSTASLRSPSLLLSLSVSLSLSPDFIRCNHDDRTTPARDSCRIERVHDASRHEDK